MQLIDIKIKNLKPGEKAFKVADGDGLLISVSTAGSKLGRLGFISTEYSTP